MHSWGANHDESTLDAYTPAQAPGEPAARRRPFRLRRGELHAAADHGHPGPVHGAAAADRRRGDAGGLRDRHPRHSAAGTHALYPAAGTHALYPAAAADAVHPAGVHHFRVHPRSPGHVQPSHPGHVQPSHPGDVQPRDPWRLVHRQLHPALVLHQRCDGHAPAGQRRPVGDHRHHSERHREHPPQTWSSVQAASAARSKASPE